MFPIRLHLEDRGKIMLLRIAMKESLISGEGKKASNCSSPLSLKGKFVSLEVFLLAPLKQEGTALLGKTKHKTFFMSVKAMKYLYVRSMKSGTVAVRSPMLMV